MFSGRPIDSHAEPNEFRAGDSGLSVSDLAGSELISQENPNELSPPKELELKADIQTYDSRRKIFLAVGNVELLINGASLKADRIELDQEFNSLKAYGSVRFSRGSNYFQASSFTYDFINKVGELKDVYGLLELDSSLFNFSSKDKAQSNTNAQNKGSRNELKSFETSKENKAIPDLGLLAVETKLESSEESLEADLGMACPPNLPIIPDWQPHPWAVTLWGGQMIDSSFGDAFVFKGRKRPEYLLGIGLQKRIYRSGVFSLELEGNVFQHDARKQSGGKFNQDIPYKDSPAQNFGEATLGIGARLWVQPWLSFSIVEGLSYYTQIGNYENTFRTKTAQLLNYLGFEIEASLNRRLSLIGRLHHRSGAFGLFDGVHGGGNGYLVGFRYRWGTQVEKQISDMAPIPVGCPGRHITEKSPSSFEVPVREDLVKDTKTNESLSDLIIAEDNSFLDINNSPAYAEKPSRRQEEDLREKRISLIDQRVSNLKLENTLTIEKRIGVPKALRNIDEKNVYGGVKPSQLTYIGNTKLIKGRIKRWRVQATKVVITPNGWNADLMGFTNDPYTPSQVRIDAQDVFAEEQKDGSTIIKTGQNQLILEERLSIPVARSYKLEKVEEVENRWVLGIDRDDRDGFYIGRNLKPINLSKNYNLYLQPQYNFQRAIDGKTGSYIAPGSSSESKEVVQSTAFSDLLGLEASLEGNLWDWRLETNADISTFNTKNLANGSRYWSAITKTSELPLVGEIDTRLFSTYRYRAWNGSLGESDIYSAFGTFLQKKGEWEWGKSKNNYLLRIGAGNYQAENYRENDLSDLWRGNLFASITNEYSLFKGKSAKLDANNAFRYSPKAILPGLGITSNINFSFSGYGDGRRQALFGISGGPNMTFGRFDKKLFSYTRLSLTSGLTFKRGSSPFTFDQAIDLGTLGIGLTQQVYGALLLNAGFEYNIDPASQYYGDIINSNVEMMIQRRAYDFGIYYNPYKKIGGFRIRLNDFSFNGTGIPFIPSSNTPDKAF